MMFTVSFIFICSGHLTRKATSFQAFVEKVKAKINLLLQILYRAHTGLVSRCFKGYDVTLRIWSAFMILTRGENTTILTGVSYLLTFLTMVPLVTWRTLTIVTGPIVLTASTMLARLTPA